jgi:hypothetical protein
MQGFSPTEATGVRFGKEERHYVYFMASCVDKRFDSVTLNQLVFSQLLITCLAKKMT